MTTLFDDVSADKRRQRRIRLFRLGRGVGGRGYRLASPLLLFGGGVCVWVLLISG